MYLCISLHIYIVTILLGAQDWVACDRDLSQPTMALLGRYIIVNIYRYVYT